MTVKIFYARRVQYATLARKVVWPTQPFENRFLLGGLSELKILVSVVRFRPGPPRITIAHLLGYFFYRDEKLPKELR
jgi:hypothetical protein